MNKVRAVERKDNMYKKTRRLAFLALLVCLAGISCTQRSHHKLPKKEVPAKGAHRLNSEMQPVIAAHNQLGPKPIETLSATEARLQPSMVDAVSRVVRNMTDVSPDSVLPVVAKVQSSMIPGPEGAVPVRVYTPEGAGPFPIIVYYHGGGWVLASPEAYDSSSRALANMSNAVVVSVDYRLAPEHKFPAAHEDSYAAFQYVATNAKVFNGDPTRIAIAGESAGGNLATAVCLMAKERNGKMPIHQVLIYPVTNYGFDTVSYLENAEAKPLNRKMMKWFFNNYLNQPSDGMNKLVSSLKASASDVSSLPSATVVTAEIDPLRSEGQAYAKKMMMSGLDVEIRDYEGVTHEFFGMGAILAEARNAQAFVSERLRKVFLKVGE
jgi:acetyl esterase